MALKRMVCHGMIATWFTAVGRSSSVRCLCILGLVHLGIQATQHGLQQGLFILRIMIVFVNEDFARSQEIPNADPFSRHLHLTFLTRMSADRPSRGRRQA